MAKRSTRGPKVTFTVDVPSPTKRQRELLKRIFKLTAIAVLGLPTDGSYARQSLGMKRRRRTK